MLVQNLSLLTFEKQGETLIEMIPTIFHVFVAESNHYLKKYHKKNDYRAPQNIKILYNILTLWISLQLLGL